MRVILTNDVDFILSFFCRNLKYMAPTSRKSQQMLQNPRRSHLVILTRTKLRMVDIFSSLLMETGYISVDDAIDIIGSGIRKLIAVDVIRGGRQHQNIALIVLYML